MYLVDTNVLSAGAPDRPGALASIADWLERNTDRLYLSTITIAEIDAVIAKARRIESRARADRLAAWLDTVLHLYGARVLPLDLPAARALSGLTDLARSVGASPGLADLAIAATAIARDYTVLTRNLRHFQDVPVRCHDPFSGLPTPD